MGFLSKCCNEGVCNTLKPAAYRGRPAHTFPLIYGSPPSYNDFKPWGGTGAAGEIFGDGSSSQIKYTTAGDNFISYKVTGDSDFVYHCCGHGGVHCYSLNTYYQNDEGDRSLQIDGKFNFRSAGNAKNFQYADRTTGAKKVGFLGSGEVYRYGYEPDAFSGSYDCCPVQAGKTALGAKVTFLVVAEGTDGVSIYRRGREEGDGGNTHEPEAQQSVIGPNDYGRIVKSVCATKSKDENGDLILVIYAGTADYKKNDEDAHHTDMSLPPPWNSSVPSQGWAGEGEYAEHALDNGYASESTDGHDQLANYAGGETIVLAYNTATKSFMSRPNSTTRPKNWLELGSDHHEVTSISISPEGVSTPTGESSEVVYISYARSTQRNPNTGYIWAYNVIHGVPPSCGGEKQEWGARLETSFSLEANADCPALGGFVESSSAILSGEVSGGHFYIGKYWDGFMSTQTSPGPLHGGVKIYKPNLQENLNKGVSAAVIMNGGTAYHGEDGATYGVYGIGANAGSDGEGLEVKISVKDFKSRSLSTESNPEGEGGEILCIELTCERGEDGNIEVGDRFYISNDEDPLSSNLPGSLAIMEVIEVINPANSYQDKWDSNEAESYMFANLTSNYYYYYSTYYTTATLIASNYIFDKIDVHGVSYANNLLALSLYEGGVMLLCNAGKNDEDIDIAGLGTVFDSTSYKTSASFIPSLSKGIMQSLFIIDSWTDGRTVFSADCIQSSVLSGPRRLGLYYYPATGQEYEPFEVTDLNRSYLWRSTSGCPGGLMASTISG
jgi:hypothetical protein